MICEACRGSTSARCPNHAVQFIDVEAPKWVTEDPEPRAMTLKGFTECPQCRGEGETWPYGEDSRPGDSIPCPSCSGVGVVPDPETVETVADALADMPYDTLELRNWGEEPVPYVHVVVARRALLAYARKAKEQT